MVCVGGSCMFAVARHVVQQQPHVCSSHRHSQKKQACVVNTSTLVSGMHHEELSGLEWVHRYVALRQLDEIIRTHCVFCSAASASAALTCQLTRRARVIHSRCFAIHCAKQALSSVSQRSSSARPTFTFASIALRDSQCP